MLFTLRRAYEQQQDANGQPIQWTNPPDLLRLGTEQRMQVAVAHFLLWAA